MLSLVLFHSIYQFKAIPGTYKPLSLQITKSIESIFLLSGVYHKASTVIAGESFPLSLPNKKEKEGSGH